MYSIFVLCGQEVPYLCKSEVFWQTEEVKVWCYNAQLPDQWENSFYVWVQNIAENAIFQDIYNY